MFNPRPFESERDLDLMRAILSAGRLARTNKYYIHPGDLNWWWYYLDPEKTFPGTTYLWESEGNVIAWAIAGDKYVDVNFLPDLDGTPEAAAMYTWGEEKSLETNAGDSNCSVSLSWVSGNDNFLIDHLEKRSFVRQDYHLVHHTMEIDIHLHKPTVPGYMIRGISGMHETPGRARAARAAFESSIEWELYLQNHIQFNESPVYDPELDIVAVAPDGEIAAFAVCWLDPLTQTGLLEPVGTHPDHKRRGLGRAVLQEGLRRMSERGMRKAEVCADHDNPGALGLYQSMGFKMDDRLLTFTKKTS